MIPAIFFLIFISTAQAKDNCICSAEVHGPETLIAGSNENELGAKLAANSINGGYLIGWSSIRDLSDNEEATTIQAQIFDRSMVPISSPIVFENNPIHISGDPIFFGGAVFNGQKHEYFVVTGNNAFTSTGTKYAALKAHIISDSGVVKATNLSIGNNLAFPGSFLNENQTEVLFNSVNREYIVKYAISLHGGVKTFIQSFDEQGKKLHKSIFSSAGHLRFDFHSNQFLFASSRLYNQFQIRTQLLNAQLKRIGPLNIVLSVPYVFNDPYQYTGPFPVYNSVRKRFVIFWYEGPWNNSRIFERSLSADGKLERKVATGINRRIWEIRFNPVTSGYVLIPNYADVLRIDSQYRVTSEFSVTCQKPPAGNPTVVFNRFVPEFLMVWFYPVAARKNIDLYGRRIAASIASDACK